MNTSKVLKIVLGTLEALHVLVIIAIIVAIIDI